MATSSAALRGVSSRRPPEGPINAAAGGQPDAMFRRTVRKTFKAIASSTQETTLLRVPWGPRLSVLFDARGAIGIGGGKLIVYAVVESSQIPLSSTPIAAPASTLAVLAEAACDSYLVTAILGTALPPGATQVESYVYAGSYAGSV